jgi:hypothetical protein
MPAVIIYGCSHIDGPALARLIPSIQDCVSAISELCLEQQQISVLMPASACPWTRGSLIVFVEGLFEKAERTDEVRKRLAETLAQTIKQWVTTKEAFVCFRDTQVRLIEVFVKRFNPDYDGFCSLEIPSSE